MIESLIGIIVLLILLVLGMPIAVSLLVGGVVGIFFFRWIWHNGCNLRDISLRQDGE